jgi:hypothetical protein
MWHEIPTATGSTQQNNCSLLGNLPESAVKVSITCTKPPSLLCPAVLVSGGLPASPPLATLLPLAAPCMPSPVLV